jgi:hypothetical protein
VKRAQSASRKRKLRNREVLTAIAAHRGVTLITDLGQQDTYSQYLVLSVGSKRLEISGSLGELLRLEGIGVLRNDLGGGYDP